MDQDEAWVNEHYVCRVLENEKPMIFRGKPYCSEDCRKRLMGEVLIDSDIDLCNYRQ